MNAEQERAEFEAWMRKRKPDISLKRYADGLYMVTTVNCAWDGYQAGRAALQSQDKEDAGLAEILREAAQIITTIPPEHAPDNIRWPIVDELEGFALQIDHARRIEGEPS